MKIRIPSPAMMIATLALLFALSGTAVAAGLITGAQIKNGTVSSLDLTNNGVKGIDVQNNTLNSSDVLNGSCVGRLRPGELPGSAPRVPPVRRPRRPRRAAGRSGSLRSPDRDGLERQRFDGHEDRRGRCPAGKQLVGGGARIVGAVVRRRTRRELPAHRDEVACVRRRGQRHRGQLARRLRSSSAPRSLRNNHRHLPSRRGRGTSRAHVVSGHPHTGVRGLHHRRVVSRGVCLQADTGARVHAVRNPHRPGSPSHERTRHTISACSTWTRPGSPNGRPRASPRSSVTLPTMPRSRSTSAPAATYTPTMATVARPPDAELLRRLRARDRTAWEELYVEYQPRLRAFAYRLAGNPHDADDLVQETFLRAVPRLDRLDPETTDVAAYLFATLKNLFLKQVEKRKRQEPMAEVPEPDDAGPHRGRPRAQPAPRTPAGRGADRERAPATTAAAGAGAPRARGPLVRGDRRARRHEGERGRPAHLSRPREPAHGAPAGAGRPREPPRGVPPLPAAPRGPSRRAAQGVEARRDARAPRGLRALPGRARGHARGVEALPDAVPDAVRGGGGTRGHRRAAGSHRVLAADGCVLESAPAAPRCRALSPARWCSVSAAQRSASRWRAAMFRRRPPRRPRRRPRKRRRRRRIPARTQPTTTEPETVAPTTTGDRPRPTAEPTEPPTSPVTQPPTEPTVTTKSKPEPKPDPPPNPQPAVPAKPPATTRHEGADRDDHERPGRGHLDGQPPRSASRRTRRA